jgi:lysophospholipase L1-like esterase
LALPTPLCLAYYQGYISRQEYINSKKLQPPNGPMTGIEKWIIKMRNLKQGLKEKFDDDLIALEKIYQMVKNIKTKLSLVDEDSPSFKSWKKIFTNLPNQNKTEEGESVLNDLILEEYSSRSPSKKVKLLILGDSLAVGVGCDSDVHVMVKVLAKTLSVTLGTDIEWKVAGIVGGTASDLKNKLVPSLKSDFLNIQENERNEVEVIVIVICGINDCKKIFENFPYGDGPSTFRRNLKDLINELRSDLHVPCRIFLPA